MTDTNVCGYIIYDVDDVAQEAYLFDNYREAYAHMKNRLYNLSDMFYASLYESVSNYTPADYRAFKIFFKHSYLSDKEEWFNSESFNREDYT